LIAYANGDLILFHQFAHRIDVDADNLSEGTEVTLPELERPSGGDADFDKHRRTVHEAGKVLLVDRKIMSPLVDFSTVIREKF
jgi:hypothetical protein